MVLYTGSLVPREVLARARPDAQVLDSSGMTLDEIIAVIVAARDAGHDVARVHTGDPLVFGSTAEQMRRLKALDIAYEVVPGVSSFTAAAAVLGRELTLPELCQTVILSRARDGRRCPRARPSPISPATGATLALFLSITLLKEVTEDLIPAYGADCPVAVVHKATCPDQKIVTGTLADIRAKVKAAGIRSQAMILVGPVLGGDRLRRLAPLRPGLQPSISQGQARRGERMTRVVPASDRVRRAPTAAARDTSLACAGTFQ